MKVKISQRLQFDPFTTVYNLEDAEGLRGQEGEVLTQNTMGETLVQVEGGQWWINDDFIEEVEE